MTIDAGSRERAQSEKARMELVLDLPLRGLRALMGRLSGQ